MTKHILLYTDDPGLGGVAQYNHSLTCGLVKLGYQVTCVQSQYDTPLIKIRENLGIKHIWLDFDSIKDEDKKVNDTISAHRIFPQVKPDLIIFSDSWALANLGAKQVAIQYNIPFIAVVGLVGAYPGGLPHSSLKLMSEVYNYAKAVIAVSENNLQLLHQGYGLSENKGEVIYYGRSKEFFKPQNQQIRENLREQLNIPQDAIVCFTAGRYDKIKGYDYQLAAIKQLKLEEIWNKLYFIWVGSGPLETELKEKIKKLQLTDKIKLLGQRFDIPELLDSSDIFILPSLLEGMPLAIMEAMAKGLPVIATNISGIPEELGNTGQLIADLKISPDITINQLVETIKLWASNEELRVNIGKKCQARAKQLFTEERMINQTKNVIERALLPVGDYVSPQLEIVKPDAAFPNMIAGNTDTCRWQYLRRKIPHNWYVDQRHPYIGFLSRDEASILYNNALQFAGKKALEIGCWLGWSACHLALAGVQLDVIDPVLENPDFYTSVSNSLRDAGVIDHVNLMAGYSPEKVHEIARENHRKWSLIFIDGNHDRPYPLNDAIACEPYAEDDAMILFHDLSSPDVAEGLDYLRSKGWNTLVYQTMQIMGVAWRGNVTPIKHRPDPSINWQLPEHLQTYPVSGFSNNYKQKALMFFPHNIYPSKTGAHQRCLSVIKALQYHGYAVTLCGWNVICDNPFPQDQLALKAIESELNIRIIVYQGTQEDYQCIQSNQSKNQDLIDYATPGLKTFFGLLYQQLNPELVVVNYAMWGNLIKNSCFKNTVTVLESHDLFTLNQKMQGSLHKYLSSPPYHPDQIPLEIVQEDFYSKQNLQASFREYECFDQFDYTLAISPQEAKEMRSHIKKTEIIYLPMTYTTVKVDNTYQEKPIFAVGPNRFNTQGYLYFTKQILPKILAVIPDFQLQVVGMICDQLAPVNGVELSGFVPDLTSVYASSCFAICPLIGGTGQQVKIVEAMAHGLPVVALSNVAHSSPIEHGVNGFIANNADEFAQYTMQLWQDRKLCESLGREARKTIADRFSPEVIQDKLTPIINKANLKRSLQLSSFCHPKILIDGVFFQLYKTGIARVWKSLLEQWANTDFANHILVLDRANTAPKINGIRYRIIHPYDYNNTDRDRQLLQQICDEESAELLISSYYTTPLNTHSVFMAYDMIPEVIGVNLNDPMWREKHKGINHASAFIAISENTAKDINKYFPEISLSSITVAHCGVDPLFSPATENEINSFKYKYGINKPYFLLGSLGGYKNQILFFQAFSQLANKTGFDVVATGVGSLLPPEWRQYTAGCTFHGLQLTDEELRLAYAGAVALVYPSLYEGFGMPVIEAMACGCPVITTPNASLPEVGGNAAIYVNADDIEGMANALCEVQKPSLRRNLISAGLQQAQKFSWTTMSEIVKEALFNAISPQIKLTNTNYLIFPNWQTDEEELTEELYNLIHKLAILPSPNKRGVGGEVITLVIDTTGTTEENANLVFTYIVMNLMTEEELDLENILNFVLINNLNEQQWAKLLPKITAKITLENENQEAINQLNLEDLVKVNGSGNNYAIFPDWSADQEELALEIGQVLSTIAAEENTTLLVNLNNTDQEEVGLFFTEITMNLMLEEGIELSDSLQINFVNFTANQWESFGGLIKKKITINSEDLLTGD